MHILYENCVNITLQSYIQRSYQIEIRHRVALVKEYLSYFTITQYTHIIIHFKVAGNKVINIGITTMFATWKTFTEIIEIYFVCLLTKHDGIKQLAQQ